MSTPRRGFTLFRFFACLAGAALVASMLVAVGWVTPAAAATPTWTVEGDGGGSQSSGGVNYLYDDSFNGAEYSVVTVTDTNGGITAPVIQSVTPSGTTGFTCSSGPLPAGLVGDSNTTPWPENTPTDTIYKCLLTVAPGPANGDDSGVTGSNGTMHTVTFAETDGTGTFTDTVTFDILPPPLAALSGTNSWTGASGTAGAQIAANDTTYGNPAVAEFSASGPSSSLLTNVSTSGGTIYTGANPTDTAGGTAAVVEVNPGSFWTGNQGSSGSQDVDQGTASTSGQKWGVNTETVTLVDVNQSCSPACLVTTASSVPASFPPSVGATGITVSGTDIPTGDTVTSGSGTGDLDLTTPPTGTVSGAGETITFSWASAASPPPSGFLTSTTTVASEASYKSGADPLGICPPTPAMIEAGIPFCQERFDYSGSGPTVGTPDVAYAGQAVPTTTTPTVALSSGSGTPGSSVGITDATNACPATIGTGSAAQNFFDGTYNAAGTSITGTYNCWYGRAGDATPVTVTVGGIPATVTPTNPSNGDVSEAFYDVNGPNDTSTYDGAGTITSMTVTGGTNTVSCGASSAGTAAAPYSDLLGDAVSGTDIPLGTEVTNVVNNATHTCSFTLSNNATATPAAETLTFYSVTLNPPQLNASITIPASTPAGPQTVKVCEATTPTSGFDWEFGLQSMAPAGSLQYVSGNSGPTEICESSSIDVTGVSSGTTSTPTNPSITLGGTNTDSATVTGGGGGGVNPTGSVNFYECGPTPSAMPCTSSNWTQFDTESLSGSANPDSVTSASFTPTSTGTWCFASVYGGDSNYAGSSDQSTDECFTVASASSSTSSTPTNSSITLGATNTDGATVTGSVGSVDPTGSVAFYECGPTASPTPCTSSNWTQFDTESLSGSANPDSVTSASFTPTSTGTWCFASVYGGDSNYAGSSDQSTDECFTVASASSSTSSTPTNSSITLGATNSDGATVTGSDASVDPTGSVAFYSCPEGVDPCTSSNWTQFDTEPLSGSANPDTVTSASFTPDATGTWCFASVYSGDGNYTGSSDQGTDECFTVTSAGSSTTSTPTSSSITLGSSNTDGATVTGSDASVDPTGSVAFYSCPEGVDPCTSSNWTQFDTEPLSGSANPDTVTSASFTPDATGTWCFAAVYSGDGNYTGSSDQGSDECFTVASASSMTITTPTSSSITLGATNTDGATVTGAGGGPDPTGSVAFYSCPEGVDPCTSSNWTQFDTEPLSGSANPDSVTSASITPDATGTWCFAAVYSGDGNYTGSSDQGSGECFTVTSAGSSTTSTPAHSSISLGGSDSDGATVTGSDPSVDPTGSVAFYECGPTASPTPCTSSNWTEFDTESLSESANPDTVTSAAFTPDATGTWCFAAVYSGDGNYTGSSDQSTGECFAVTGVGSTTTSSPSSSTAALDGPNSDNAVVTGADAAANAPYPTGRVTFYTCPKGVDPCTSANWTELGSPVTLGTGEGDTNRATSTDFDNDSTGTWCFAAVYSGDGNYGGSSDQTSNECYTVAQASTTTISAPLNSTITEGQSNIDQATVYGNDADSSPPAPSGTVTFYQCGPTSTPTACTGGTQVGSAVNLTTSGSNTATASSHAFTPSASPTPIGYWCFRAVYSGDGNYFTSSDDSSTNECFYVNGPLTITTTSLPNGTKGDSYSGQVNAAGGTTPYKWSKSGALPRGLRLNRSTGAISGTPSRAGSYTFTIKVKDSSHPKETASKSFTVTISS